MGCLIPLSFICGIVAGVLIWRGGEMSKRTEEVETRLRGALEKEGIPLERDDRASLSITSVQDSEPAREKKTAHTAVQGPPNGVNNTSFDGNKDHDTGLQGKAGDGGEELASEVPTIQPSLKTVCAEASTPDVLEDRLPSRKTERLHESSRRVSGTHHPSYRHAAYEV
jgi:hypothetical protein